MKRFIVLMMIILITLFCFYFEGHTQSPQMIVLGSEPECIAAAVTASQQGYTVILITEDLELGGLMTEGLLTILDLNYDNQGGILNTGFFTLLLEHCSNGANLDLSLVKTFFNEQIKSNNIQVYLGASNLKPIVRNNKVHGAYFVYQNKPHEISADWVIDGSSEAQFTRGLGASYLSGRSEFGFAKEYAAATLVFSVKGVNWETVTSYLLHDYTPYSHVKGNTAWGYAQMYRYLASTPQIKMRGLNLSRQNDDSVIINALLIFDTPPDDKIIQERNYHLAKAEIPSIIDYMQKHCKGFEEAHLDQIAKRLYIREGIRIVGEETLHGNDIFEHTHYLDTIAYGSYPIDLQATNPTAYGSALSGTSLYSIPLGTMLPKGIPNVLVIGRKASFDIVAHGSARTLPVLIQMAENGTLAMVYSQQHAITITDLINNPTEWQNFTSYLKQKTAFKVCYLPPSPLLDHWYAPYLRKLMQQGLFSTGYNELNLSAPCTKQTLLILSTLISQHTSYSLPIEYKTAIHQLTNSIDFSTLYQLLGYLCNQSFSSLEDLYVNGFIDATIYEHLLLETSPTLWSTYVLFGSVINHLLPYQTCPIQCDPIEAISH